MRFKIVLVLYKGEELCVCDVVNIVGFMVVIVFYYLRLLCNIGIVNYCKEGKLVFYFLRDVYIK